LDEETNNEIETEYVKPNIYQQDNKAFESNTAKTFETKHPEQILEEILNNK